MIIGSDTVNQQFLVRVAYLEIYLEEVYDLLAKRKQCELREDKDSGVYVKVCTFSCGSFPFLQRNLDLHISRHVSCAEKNGFLCISRASLISASKTRKRLRKSWKSAARTAK